MNPFQFDSIVKRLKFSLKIVLHELNEESQTLLTESQTHYSTYSHYVDVNEGYLFAQNEIIKSLSKTLVDERFRTKKDKAKNMYIGNRIGQRARKAKRKIMLPQESNN